MMKKVLSVAAIILVFSVTTEAALFSDDFDDDSSAAWNIIRSSTDTSAIFAFDYSTIGVPPSPNGGGTTLGLRMAANMDSPKSLEAITLTPVGQEFTGSYVLKFDMWINANGSFPDGGIGSTESLTAGIGHDDVTLNQYAASGSGCWFAVTGEGGAYRDYQAFKNSQEQWAESGQFFAGTSSVDGGAHNNWDPYYADFGEILVEAAVPEQTLLHEYQTGTTLVGTVGFAWYEVTITVDGENEKVLWEIDDLPIAELDLNIGNVFPSLSGNISIGYMDTYESISDNPEVSFGLIDNLVVLLHPSFAYLANTPSPKDNATFVPADTILTWQDPIEISPMAYDVYLVTGNLGDPNSTDPNFTEADKVVDYQLVNSYEPSGETELEPETLYFWRVDVYDPNEPGNPILRVGNVWSFETAPPEPMITEQPERVVTVEAGETAQLSIEAVNVISYTWYEITDGGPVVVPGADTDTLTIDDVGLEDEGYYYCSVAEGVDSDPGRILTRRKMAHWKFDGDLVDEVDSANDGTSPGTITYAGGVDGSAVKIAEPDEFVLIDNAIGLLGDVSVSMWINPPASVLEGSAILLVPQEGEPDYGGTGSVSITTVGNAMHAEVRDSGVDDSAWTLTADEWNHLLFVYTPAAREAVYYINGEHAATVTSVNPEVLPNLTALGIGARNPSDIVDIFEQGLIDDVRIYNFELSSLNAASLYTEFADDSICLDGVLPEFDLNGDCIFDLMDFAEIAATWLECNLVPDCIEPEIP
jgi:hypothetical protein